MDDGRLHEKRFVVLRVESHTTTCVVNSEISAFIRNRPPMLQCQVLIPMLTHNFMDHDSFIDCSRTRSFVTADVIADLMNRPEWMLGDIAPGLRPKLAAAFRQSPTLSKADIDRLCEALEEAPSLQE